MAGRKSNKADSTFPDSAPALTPEEWENRLIAMSFSAVEQRIRTGTATAAEYVHFLKAGSVKQQEEMRKLREENALLRAKTSAIEAEKDRAGFYREVIDALSACRTETTDVPFDPYVY